MVKMWLTSKSSINGAEVSHYKFHRDFSKNDAMQNLTLNANFNFYA